MKYPIGVQSLEDLRTTGYVYIDKTDLVYNLANSYKYVFLGRPRRNSESEVYSLTKEIVSGDVMGRLKSIFYSIPYSRDNTAKVPEDQFRNIIYLTFKLLGFSAHTECHMSRGRSDAVVTTCGGIYVFEFKVDSTPGEAFAQILDRGCA